MKATRHDNASLAGAGVSVNPYTIRKVVSSYVTIYIYIIYIYIYIDIYI